MGAVAMSRLPESRNYLMKCLGFVLLLGFISLGAIGGCGNNTADEPDPIDDFLNIVKTLKVEIASADLAMLQEAGLKLNISKQVGNENFNVVWQSISNYGETNTYQWSPIFEVFGSNEFQVSVTVVSTTNLVNVSLGQEVTLDSIGDFGPAMEGGPVNSISIINDFGSIHLGLAQQLTDPTGVQAILPIFVTPFVIFLGMESLTPVEKVLVWFGDTETSTMFSDARPNSVLVDLTNIDEKTVSFSNGEWSLQMM
jgi:hypothetical protein